MTDERSSPWKGVRSGKMATEGGQFRHGYGFVFQKQKVKPVTIKWTVNCWHPGYSALSSSLYPDKKGSVISFTAI